MNKTTKFLTIFGQTIVIYIFAQSQKSPEPPVGVELQKNVCYSEVDGKSLFMDIARPSKVKGALPVIICIHGGAWVAGNKKTMLKYAYNFAQHGYVAAAIDYRLAPFNHFPAQILDAKNAVNYLREHARELSIDPDRIAAVGDSAGAYLALFLGVTDGSSLPITAASKDHPSLIKAVVSIWGPVDFNLPLTIIGETVTENLLGVTRLKNPLAYELASPISYLSPSSAHFLLVNGDKDGLVLADQPAKMMDACKKLGIPAQLFILHNCGHADQGSAEQQRQTMIQISEFLKKNL